MVGILAYLPKPFIYYIHLKVQVGNVAQDHPLTIYFVIGWKFWKSLFLSWIICKCLGEYHCVLYWARISSEPRTTGPCILFHHYIHIYNRVFDFPVSHRKICCVAVIGLDWPSPSTWRTRLDLQLDWLVVCCYKSLSRKVSW